MQFAKHFSSQFSYRIVGLVFCSVIALQNTVSGVTSIGLELLTLQKGQNSFEKEWFNNRNHK